MTRLALGLDVGGTNVKGVLLTEAGQCLARATRPSQLAEGPHAVAPLVANLAHELMHRVGVTLQSVTGAGVGVCAYIHQDGRIHSGIKMGRWAGCEFGALLREYLDLPASFCIDVNAAVIGEAVYGSGRSDEDLICLTVGTGIGAGVMLSRRIALGGWVCGVGHSVVLPEGGPPCECGSTGCLESLCSARALVALGRKAVTAGLSPVLTALCNGDPDRLSARHVIEAAQSGDWASVRAAGECGKWLGLGLANLLAILGPIPIAVGGGLAQLGDLLLEPARQYVRAHAFPLVCRSVLIRQAEQNEYLGSYGATAMVLQGIRINFEDRIGADMIRPIN